MGGESKFHGHSRLGWNSQFEIQLEEDEVGFFRTILVMPTSSRLTAISEFCVFEERGRWKSLWTAALIEAIFFFFKQKTAYDIETPMNDSFQKMLKWAASPQGTNQRFMDRS